MAIISIREALNQAFDEEMQRNEDVFIMGEEVAEYNGAYKVTKGLWDKYGDKRVIDTPITEEGFTGVGIGAAMVGLRPIVEWMTHNFGIQAFDQVFNNAAKMNYMSGGQYKMPIVFRGPNGAAEFLASQHSQALEAVYSHFPGLKVIAPSTAYDYKGLMKTAIRDDNPVIFLESEMTYGKTGEVPSEEYLIPFGVADVKKEGTDVTVITWSKEVFVAQEVAEELEAEGVNVEIVDIRSIRPLDEETIYKSVRKTNRVVIAQEAWPFSSVGSHIAFLIAQNCFDDLDAPVEVVSMLDVPMPYNGLLEKEVLPHKGRIKDAINKVMYR